MYIQQESSKDKVLEEQKYHREVLKSIERERQLEIESFTLKIETIEKENIVLGSEVSNLKHLIESLELEKQEVEDQLTESRKLLLKQQEETNKSIQEKLSLEEQIRVQNEEQHISLQELSSELEMANNLDNADMDTSSDKLAGLLQKLEEIKAEVNILKQENKGCTLLFHIFSLFLSLSPKLQKNDNSTSYSLA